MAQITSSVGLISGINTSQIISELMNVESEPATLLQSQMSNVSEQKSAFTDLISRLTTLKTTGTMLSDPTSFQAATATSSDTSVLTATAANGAAVGNYQFQVARMVTTQQTVSQGFADTSSTPIGAGTISIEEGGGQLSNETELSDLNGGAGVSRGVFKITDGSGSTATIDTSDAVSLDDVVKKINTSTDISVKASIQDNHLVLTDESGGTGTLTVRDAGDGKAAADLGIVGTATNGTLTGQNINYLSTKTSVSVINDGRGIRLGTGGADISLDPGDGQGAIQLSLAGKKSIGDVISAINTAGGGRITAAVSSDGSGIQITNKSGGAVSATDLNGSNAAEDLGLVGAASSGGVTTGKPILAGIDTVLVSSLNGGQGLSLGTISVQSRAATTKTDIDLSGATTVQQVMEAINGANAGVTASLNNAGDGIAITDTSGGSGTLSIGDVSGTSAEDLGIGGNFDTSTSTVNGKNLQVQWVSQNTYLSTLNGGKGIAQGSFTITDSSGKAATVTVGTSSSTLGDLIENINTRGIGVTASVNSQGNGLLLTDTAGGTGKLTVTDDSSTTAADLNIAGTATGTTIDGSYEKTIAVTANDTLSTVQQKINALGFGVTAQIINDGSTSNPYRLSLTSTNSGKAGAVVFDDGGTNLNSQTLVQAQDAAVFVGGSGASQPLLITSSTNQLTGVIPGVTVSLQGVSSSPVSLSVTNSDTAVTAQITSFVSDFNDMIDQISTLTSYDTDTNQAGLLLGDSTVQEIQTILYGALQTVVKGTGSVHTLSDLGLSFDDDAKLSFDQDKFDAAYAADPTNVQNFFAQANTGAGVALSNAITQLIDPADGVLPLENKTLDNRTADYQDQLDQLNSILADKKNTLENQFANMESVLAGLQSQQSSLSSIGSISSSSK